MNDQSTPPDDKQLAASLLQQGRAEEAKALLERVCAEEPQDAQAWFTLGLAYAEVGRFQDGEQCFHKSAHIDPGRAVIRYNLARSQQSQGKLEEAAANYRQALHLRPDMEAAYSNLGAVLLDQGKPEQALEGISGALALPARMPETFCVMGNICKRLSRPDESLDYYRRALSIKQDFVSAHEGMGMAWIDKGEFKEAMKCFQSALELQPDSLAARCGMGICHNELGFGYKAEVWYREALSVDPDYLQAHLGMGRILLDSGLFEEALTFYRKVLELEPQHPSAEAETVIVLVRLGRFEEAWEHLEPLLTRQGVDKVTVALAFADICSYAGRCEQALRMVLDILAGGQVVRLTQREKVLLHFAAGRLADRAGAYETAFEQYRLGNKLACREFNTAYYAAKVTRLMEVYSPEFMKTAPRATRRSRRPVFIVGMPRSGTTLVEQILATHPAVYGAGELEDISWITLSLSQILDSDKAYPDCVTELTQDHCDQLADKYLERLSSLAPATALRVTDKMPGNYLHLGLIALLFPEARVIHCVRDPLDTCLSCFFQFFISATNHPYAYNLEYLGFTYRQYERLMKYWHAVIDLPMMEVRYEELVADQERITRELLAFCDLPWDDSCLNFHKTRRNVVTASYAQVRRPLYNSSVGRWKHYEPYLEPLRRALAGEE